MKVIIIMLVLCFAVLLSQAVQLQAQSNALSTVLVNQAGYNTGESKRFVAWGVVDGTDFEITNVLTGDVVYKGKVKGYSGDFSCFNPSSTSQTEYVINVQGLAPSVPFRIAPYFLELLSSRLAYEFFIDVRGSTNPVHSNEANVYGGGPSRDGGAWGLETIFETMFYASNPALFDNWKKELGEGEVPDLIKLILWHAEFAYHHVNYNGPIGSRNGWVGYEGTEKMKYDYWNTLDQLAAVCAAYHSFLKPYLSEDKYRKYRKVCLEKWTAYERHKVVRYWTYSNKWVDSGYQEFNEMGNAFGQSVFSNLFMYLTELNEKDGKPEQFLKWAQESTNDIIKNWNFNNIRHMWWIRNAEHITPQALAFFLLTAPDKAPQGSKEKLQAWMKHILAKTDNPWQYRVHSDTEWAHPKTKELGGAPALGGSLFAAAYILNMPTVREQAWSQVNFVFGLNPLGAHFSNKSKERTEIGGYWEGVEHGWPQAHPDGYGLLGLVKGTLDGSPLDKDFPRLNNDTITNVVDTTTDMIGKNAYATEGWAISNRGWMATFIFSTLHSTKVSFLDAAGKEIRAAKKGSKVFIELKAPLNIHPDKIDEGWIELTEGNGKAVKYNVTETNINSNLFRTAITVPKSTVYKATYGYWGFKKEAELIVQ